MSGFIVPEQMDKIDLKTGDVQAGVRFPVRPILRLPFLPCDLDPAIW